MLKRKKIVSSNNSRQTFTTFPTSTKFHGVRNKLQLLPVLQNWTWWSKCNLYYRIRLRSKRYILRKISCLKVKLFKCCFNTEKKINAVKHYLGHKPPKFTFIPYINLISDLEAKVQVFILTGKNHWACLEFIYAYHFNNIGPALSTSFGKT